MRVRKKQPKELERSVLKDLFEPTLAIPAFGSPTVESVL